MTAVQYLNFTVSAFKLRHILHYENDLSPMVLEGSIYFKYPSLVFNTKTMAVVLELHITIEIVKF